jgi:hypothetical protein
MFVYWYKGVIKIEPFAQKQKKDPLLKEFKMHAKG